jgi:hypothetical protein
MYKLATPRQTVTIELDFPLEGPDGLIKQLVMRAPQVLEQVQVSKLDDAQMEIELFAMLCGVDKQLIHALDGLVDYPKLTKAYMGFRKPPKQKASA